MVDYTNEPGTIRPDGTRVPYTTSADGTRVPPASTTITNRNGMSGTGWAVVAVIVLVVLAFVAWSYSNTGAAVIDAPGAPAVEATPDAAPLDTAPGTDTGTDTAPVVEDSVAPLSPAPADDAAPLDAAPADVAPDAAPANP